MFVYFLKKADLKLTRFLLKKRFRFLVKKYTTLNKDFRLKNNTWLLHKTLSKDFSQGLFLVFSKEKETEVQIFTHETFMDVVAVY